VSPPHPQRPKTVSGGRVDRVTVMLTTDRTGRVVTIDDAGAKAFNISARRANGRSLLQFLQRDREEVLRDLRAVASGDVPPRRVVIRPRERGPRAAMLSLSQVDAGIRWTLVFDADDGA